MWVLPKESGGHPWPLWSSIKENEWFLLTRNNAGLIVEKPFRIILKIQKTSGWIVAVGKEAEIMVAWSYIENNLITPLNKNLPHEDKITYALSKFQSLALDESLKTLPTDAQGTIKPERVIKEVDMVDCKYDDCFYFESGDVTAVESDLQDLARENAFFTTNQHTLHNLATSDTKIPASLNLPQGENVLALFSTSLWSTGLPRPGSLYVTQNYIGFHAPGILLISSQNIAIPLTEVVHVQYFLQAGFECVQVVTKKATGLFETKKSKSLSGFTTIAFAAVHGGQHAYEVINEMWKLAMKKLQQTASDQKRVREGEAKEFHLITYEEAVKLKQTLQNTTPLTSMKNPKGEGAGVVTVVRNTLERISNQVVLRFRLPNNERLLSQASASLSIYAKRGNSFVKSSHDSGGIDGVIYLTTHFLVFQDRVLFKSSPLGQQSQEQTGKRGIAFQNVEQEDIESDWNVDSVDEAQNTAVMEAEWDVAAAEMNDSGSSPSDPASQRAKIRKEKTNVPSTSLGTKADAQPRIWLVIPLREIFKLKIGKPSANVSTAYTDFGITPYIINAHFPYNMYTFTLINRPHFFHCLNKVFQRVLKQEQKRPALGPYSLDLTDPSNYKLYQDVLKKILPTSNPSSHTFAASEQGLEPPPREIYFTNVATHPLSTSESKYPPHIWNDPEQFSSTYRARERLQEEKFLNYFHKFGSNTSFVRRGPELPLLVRDGIPHALRGHLWFTLSGASSRFATAQKEYYYEKLLKTNHLKTSVSVEQIERDLYRSMPSHPFYSKVPTIPEHMKHLKVTEEEKPKNDSNMKKEASNQENGPKTAGDGPNISGDGPKEQESSATTIKMWEDTMNPPKGEPIGISRLRRVLVAYSWHNPVIGYCQSMNIVVASLLLYMNEEEAFYTLITLVEYLEEYWTREMIGAVVDMLVLKDVLKMKRPKLVHHLESLQLDYSIVALPWFMCLFIGYVPTQLSLRLMDCFFFNAGLGKATATLFQAAIALFSICETELFQAFDSVAVSDILRQSIKTIDSDKLISIVFSDDSLSLRTSILDELRNFHRYSAIKDIELQNQEEDFMTLVYGAKPKYIIPSKKTSPPNSYQDEEDTKKKESPLDDVLQTPTTPVHFQLNDLKRFYIDFKQSILIQDSNDSSSASNNSSSSSNSNASSSSSSSSHNQPIAKTGEDDVNSEKARIANTKSFASSLSFQGFKHLFTQHLSWWPNASSDLLLRRIFDWIDRSHTQRVTFVEYIQGLDLICFAEQNVLLKLFFYLFSRREDSVPPYLTFKGFQHALKCLYFTLLYSRKDEMAAVSESDGKPVRRRKLDMGSLETTDDLDDWLLVSVDEQYDNLVTLENQKSVYESYSEDGKLQLEKYLVGTTNLLQLIAPQSLHSS